MSKTNITTEADLLKVKKLITKIGVDYMNANSPIKLSDAVEILEPFVKIDDAINSAIKKINKN